MQQVILRIDRARSSAYGNPSFWITFTDGARYKTAANADFAYSIGNQGMREGSRVVYEVGGRGTITCMGPAS